MRPSRWNAEPHYAKWIAISVLLHALAFGGVVLSPLGSTPPEPEPIEVTLIPEPEPEPEPEPPIERLTFRPVQPVRVREGWDLPRETLALVAPPPDATLVPQASGGGLEVALSSAPNPLSRFSLDAAATGDAGVGGGAGNALGIGSGSFAETVGQLRQVGLDVVFVIDATGSMGWLIHEVKTQVRSLVSGIRALVPVTRFGIVAYRDDDDPEFLTRVQPLTLSVRKLERFLDRLEARGGGDVPEAVDSGLRAAIEKAGWRENSKAMLVLIGDAPPHPERMGETLTLVEGFHARGGTVTAVDVSFDANPKIAAARLEKRVEDLVTLNPRGVLEEYRAIARAGGGDASTLQGDTRVVGRLAVLVFGERYADEIRPLLGDL